jgi:predicted Na+-dependent transporter
MMKYLINIAIVAGIVCGSLLPALHVYKGAIVYIVGFILVLNFFEIDFRWRNFFRFELVLTVLLSAVAMPLLYYLFLSRGLHPEYRVGILLTAIAPSGLMPLVLGRFFHNIDHDLVLSNFLVTTFGAILYLPLMVKWLAGTNVSVPSTQLLYKTALMILLPYGTSLIMKLVFPGEKADAVKRCSKPIVLVLLFFICLLVASGASQRIQWDLSLLHVIVLVFSVYLVQGGIAYFIGRFFWGIPVRRTLALISSSRNNQISLGIAILNFSPATAIPCIFGFIFHHVTNAIWLYLFRK